ncbi:MAG: hypothetical protein AAGA20_18445, partial [Planctomycetota bacterium]
MADRLLLSSTILLVSACASIEDQSGWYTGASLGTSFLELERGDEDTAFAFDEEDTAWKAYGGYRWDSPHFHFGLEGGYVDLGDPPAFFPDLVVWSRSTRHLFGPFRAVAALPNFGRSYCYALQFGRLATTR